MSDQKPEKQALSAAEAAKRVRRRVVETSEAGDAAEKFVPVAAKEVLAWRDYGTHVVVVTIDGRKLSSAAEAD